MSGSWSSVAGSQMASQCPAGKHVCNTAPSLDRTSTHPPQALDEARTHPAQQRMRGLGARPRPPPHAGGPPARRCRRCVWWTGESRLGEVAGVLEWLCGVFVAGRPGRQQDSGPPA